LNFQGSILQKIVFALLTVILCAVGWFLTQSGFDQVRELQEIERLPTSEINSALEGEVKLQVRVEREQSFIQSEYFKVPSVYYFYRYEEEETDSDGDKYWDTKFTRTNAMDFIASDASGKILVRASSLANGDLDFSLPTSQQVTIGDTRHTEWRIEPGNNLFILGYLQFPSDKAQLRAQNYDQPAPMVSVGFVEPGSYLPLISKYSESKEKSDLGLGVVFMVCGGISLFAFAALSLVITIGIHRILAFLFFLSFSAIIPLSQLGISMLYQDIVTASKKLEQKEIAVKMKVGQISELSSLESASWSEFLYTVQQPSVKSAQTDGIIVDFVYTQEQYRSQLSKFPNNFIAWLYSVESKSLFDELPADLKAKTKDKLDTFSGATTGGVIPYVIGGAGLLVCLLLTLWGFKLIRLKRHIENVPTSKTSALVFGLSELKGRVKQIDDTEPLRSPLTNSQCYWYHYKVEEKRGSGKDAKWVTITNRKDYAPFMCEDQFGSIKIIPDKAEVISKNKASERRGNRRYTELTLKLNDKVYLIGQAKIDRDVGDALEIRQEKGSPFLISNLTEEAVMYRKANGGMLSLTAAFSALMFCALFYLGVSGSFSPTDYLASALVAPIYMSVVILVLHYNDLIFLKQRVSRNLSNINVSMQKRFDLIPNLEKIVKKFMVHEQSLHTSISDLRSNFKKNFDTKEKYGELIEKEQEILTSFFALAEDYPELKANKLNQKLMNKLVDLENEIALMREGYNDAVEYYNTRIASVPDVFFARMFGFKAFDLLRFETKKFERIKFD